MTAKSVVASFLNFEEAVQAAEELAAEGTPRNALHIAAEKDDPGAQLGKQRQEAEQLLAGPGVTMPGPAGRAAVAGSIWGIVLGTAAGVVVGIIGFRGMPWGVVISVVAGATAGAVFGGFWAGAARADQEASKTEAIEAHAAAVSVDVRGRDDTLRAMRTLRRLHPDHVVVLDETGKPVDDETDEAIWMRDV